MIVGGVYGYYMYKGSAHLSLWLLICTAVEEEQEKETFATNIRNCIPCNRNDNWIMSKIN